MNVLLAETLIIMNYASIYFRPVNKKNYLVSVLFHTNKKYFDPLINKKCIF